MKYLYWINIHYACYGIIVHDGVVIEAPPIAKWAIGKTFDDFKKFVKKKNGQIKGKHLPG
jgi:hypothetical protein